MVQVFKVEVALDGQYYLSAWVNCSLNEKGEKLEYIFQVNNEKEKYKIKAKEDNSHAIDLQEKKITLQSGTNTIVIKTKKPECPNVEFIKVSLDKEKRAISNEKYTKYIEELSKHKLPDNYAEIKKAAQEAELSNSELKSYKLTNPSGNYEHEMELDFGYSYYMPVSLPVGTVEFETVGATSDPVLQLFKSPGMTSHTWTDDDGGSGYNSKITANITSPGLYYLFIRKYFNPSSVVGTCNLYKNGSLYASNCAISGSGIRCDISVSETLNWFTADLSGDSRIWIENQSGFPGKIVAYNDDWCVSSDFTWGESSRLRINLNTSIRAVIVSCFSSYAPTGNCDLYMNCKNANNRTFYDSWGNPYHLCDVFENLEPDDAIESALASSVYNCISWSGGITDDWYWPPSLFDPYYAGTPLASFDNFYGSSRYVGAMIYDQSGATASNNVVDLWYNPNYYGQGQGSYTHGSVTKPGNNHPHGYDWESKPGGLNRTFHPRHSLNSTQPYDYGYVDKYYKPTSLKSAMLLDESIARGLSVIENIEFTAEEKNNISESINSLSVNQKEELESRYEVWKRTWDNPKLAIQSNPRMYANSKEYDEFINYCKLQGESVWPFIFDKFQIGDFFVINALEDLTLEENMDILEKVKEENRLKSTTENGAAIVRTPRTVAIKYIKELLKSSSKVTCIKKDGVIYSNSYAFNVYPNPVDATSQISFNLPTDAKVLAQVIDLNGRVLSVAIQEQMLKAGKQSYQLNIPENFKGTCLVKLLINNNVNVQLIVVQ